LALTSQ